MSPDSVRTAMQEAKSVPENAGGGTGVDDPLLALASALRDQVEKAATESLLAKTESCSGSWKLQGLREYERGGEQTLSTSVPGLRSQAGGAEKVRERQGKE